MRRTTSRISILLAAALILGFPIRARSQTPGQTGPSFKKVLVIVLENASYSQATAQPFLSQFAAQGALLTDFAAEAHPSLPNYIALVAGTTAGVWSDRTVNLDVRHIGDLLEAHGKTWKAYAQDYPGGCFRGAQAGSYYRKHLPFISFANVQNDPVRCGNITSDAAFQTDAAANRLPDFSLFVPNIDNDGHNTNAAFADQWLASFLNPLFQNADMMKGLLIVVTFDEDDLISGNHIYTALYGDSVAPGSVSAAHYTHYSLLRTVEDTLGLGTLGQNDDSAAPISGVWR